MSKKFYSAPNFLINLFGGICAILSVKITLYLYPDMDVFLLSIIFLVAAIIPIIFCEVLFLKVHRRDSVGLIKPTKPDKNRLSLKLLGYYTSLAFIMLFYYLLPAYEDEFFENAFYYLLPLLIIYIIGGWIYMSEADVRLKNPYDAYWHLGNFFTGQWSKVDKDIIFAHLKSLILRAYFIPVMLVYLVSNTTLLVNGQDEFSKLYLENIQGVDGIIIIKFFVLIYFFLAAIDVLFAVIGYLMAFRMLDSNIRSTEPTFLGWFVCIICYYPFFETIMVGLFLKELYSNPEWYTWLEGMPVMIIIWGVLVLIGMCLESLTTLTFGIRFSNLTYRGLITQGPFRFTKHPQYVFKMMNRFCFYMPFLSLFGFVGAVTNVIMFIGVCFLYYLRAKTEENHLSRYPEYVEYANWINEHGAFRKIGKFVPFLVYSEEKAKAGKLF